jgi:hypothetical protein
MVVYHDDADSGFQDSLFPASYRILTADRTGDNWKTLKGWPCCFSSGFRCDSRESDQFLQRSLLHLEPTRSSSIESIFPEITGVNTTGRFTATSVSAFDRHFIIGAVPPGRCMLQFL